MAGVSNEVVIRQITTVLKEALHGPQGPWSYFTDNRKDAGLLGSIEPLDATAASRPLGGSTVAAHVHHVVFALKASAAWIRGDRSPNDWPSSWNVSEVDDGEWDDLRNRLRTAFDDLLEAVESHAADGEEAFGGAVGVLAHVACHLGAIRQKIRFGGTG